MNLILVKFDARFLKTYPNQKRKRGRFVQDFFISESPVVKTSIITDTYSVNSFLIDCNYILNLNNSAKEVFNFEPGEADKREKERSDNLKGLLLKRFERHVKKDQVYK